MPAWRAAAIACRCKSPAFSTLPVSRNSFVQPANTEASVSGFARSPWTQAMPGSACGRLGLRTSARAGMLARASNRRTSPPIRPVPPVTRIIDGLSKDLCDPQEQTKILLELTRRGHIVAQRQQYLPGGHDELRIGQPDLMLFRLRSVRDSVELHGAAERPGVSDREG